MAFKLIAALGLASVGCAAVTNRKVASRRRKIESDYPPEGQMIDVNGRQVHAVVAGNGPDVIMLHGAGGNTREFTFSFMDMLKDRYRVIIFDRPGLGYTDRTDSVYDDIFSNEAESPAEQADLLCEAAKTLGVERAIVVGHSFGGTVALAWALDHSQTVAGVVNICAPSHPWPGNLAPFYTVPGTKLGGALVPPLVGAFAGDTRVDASISSVFAPQPVPQGYAEHIGAHLLLRPASFRANA